MVMNGIRFWITVECDVQDGESYGPYVAERTYPIAPGTDIESFVPLFLSELRERGQEPYGDEIGGE